MPKSPVVFLTLLCALVTPLLAQEKPNIVIFLTDDQGWGDLSVHGNTNLATPNIDSLAKDGTMFDRFYVCPVCAPTRAEFLTGRYYGRTGVRGVSTGQERLNTDEVTLADTLKAAGYTTGAFGKWHNGSQHPYHPNARGFDEYYGFTSGHWGNYFNPALERNGEQVRGEGYITDDLTTKAMEFIEANQEEPFLCYIPYCTPHSPMQVPDEFYDKFAEGPLEMRHRDPSMEDDKHLRAALAMCENIDMNVGRVLDKLDELKLAENTIVIYFSDNGPNGYRWNDGMKGRKGSIDEGGVRVPFFIRWPGHVPAGKKVTEIAGAIDLLPTLSAMTGSPLISKKPIDGKDITPLIKGEAVDWPAREIISYRGYTRRGGKQASIRTQQYRLDNDGKLYDMVADPGQTVDVAAANPQVVRELQGVKTQFLKEIADVSGEDVRPFPVGYSHITALPARDGEPHGNAERSARAPNCSFFQNLASPEDYVTWHVEVADAAEYEATVYYTCAASDVGCVMELSLGDVKVETKVTEAHDPPLYGMSDDRSERGSESYVKDFKPLTIGKIKLPETEGLLTLKPKEVTGENTIDVRYVILKKLD